MYQSHVKLSLAHTMVTYDAGDLDKPVDGITGKAKVMLYPCHVRIGMRRLYRKDRMF